jgi:hypothetical protein
MRSALPTVDHDRAAPAVHTLEQSGSAVDKHTATLTAVEHNHVCQVVILTIELHCDVGEATFPVAVWEIRPLQSYAERGSSRQQQAAGSRQQRAGSSRRPTPA